MGSITINLGRYSMTMAEAVALLGITPLLLLVSGLVLAVIGIALAVFWGIWIYNDAKVRSNDPVLWTLIALFAPMPIGMILYLLIGRSKEGQSTGRYLKPLITTATIFVLNLFVVIGCAVYLLILMSQHGMI